MESMRDGVLYIPVAKSTGKTAPHSLKHSMMTAVYRPEIERNSVQTGLPSSREVTDRQ